VSLCFFCPPRIIEAKGLFFDKYCHAAGQETEEKRKQQELRKPYRARRIDLSKGIFQTSCNGKHSSYPNCGNGNLTEKEMTHPLYHAESSARRFGGQPSDFIEIHSWFDATKESFCDFRHRALRHHAEGIFLCESIYGISITNSEGREVPVRILGELHCLEDMGRVPTLADWLSCIKPEPWMARATITKGHLNRRRLDVV